MPASSQGPPARGAGTAGLEGLDPAERSAFLISVLEGSTEHSIVAEDLEGRILSWNEGARRIYGYEPAEVVGRSSFDLCDAGELSPGRAQSILDEARSAGRWAGQLGRVRKDGTKFRASVTLTLRRDAAGRPAGFTMISRHLTESERIETLERRVRERTAELEAFSYALSHDLRGPLRAIAGFSAVLREDHGGKLDAEGTRCLERIAAAGRRMGMLIDALVYLTRLSRTEVKPRPLDLTRIANAIVEDARAAAPARRVRVVVQDGLGATADEALVTLTLHALIGNAWKFTADRADAMIEVGCEDLGGERVYYVRDNGVGFETAHAEELFAPFQGLRARSGSGEPRVGLAAAARMVQRHGGRIWAEGEPGRGATFHFTLSPRGASAADERPPGPATAGAGRP